MQHRHHFDAQHSEAVLRWEHDNDLVRPYETLPLITRTQATSSARRISPREVLIVTPQSVRVLRWALPAPVRSVPPVIRPRSREQRTVRSRSELCCSSRALVLNKDRGSRRHRATQAQ